MVLVALGITSLWAAIKSTVTSTALPHIAGALDAGELHMWFVNPDEVNAQLLTWGTMQAQAVPRSCIKYSKVSITFVQICI